MNTWNPICSTDVQHWKDIWADIVSDDKEEEEEEYNVDDDQYTCLIENAVSYQLKQ